MNTEQPLTWNRITRISHWLIAIPVLLDFFIEGGDRSHKVIGYVAAVTVLLRLPWGFITKDMAGFRHFPLGMARTLTYARSVFSKNKISYEGHNPLASWTYILIWILVLALGLTGYMMGLDQYWGEEWLEELHEGLSSSLAALVAIHLLGLTIDSWKFKRKTWLGMITGKKS